MRIVNVVGARPNFMKIAPIMRAFEAAISRGADAEPLLVHTGQHYDFDMSDAFFRDLEIPDPDIHLGVGSGSHAAQTAEVMTRFEEVLQERGADLVVVVGDVNSTLAAAIAAVKLHIPVAHVEAGLRSFDRRMPEEINRLLTDQVADLLFTTCEDAGENLIREGVDPRKIHLVGNVMIDTLFAFLGKARETGTVERLGLQGRPFGLVTLHRPSNVDAEETLEHIVSALLTISEELPVLFPAHPRTTSSLKRFGMVSKFTLPREGEAIGAGGLYLLPPFDYLAFAGLMEKAALVLTDSGGIQEETTALGVPCLTIRETTERPVTVSLGTNTLVGSVPERIVAEARNILAGRAKEGLLPPLWDGKAAPRIVEVILKGGWLEHSHFVRNP